MVVVAAVLEGIREAAPPLEVAHQSHAEEVLREDQEEEALAIAVAGTWPPVYTWLLYIGGASVPARRTAHSDIPASVHPVSVLQRPEDFPT